MNEKLEAILIERIKLKNDAEYIPTQDDIEAELIIYDIELEEIARLQEIEDRKSAVKKYNKLDLIHVDMSEIELDGMTAKKILKLIKSLKNEEKEAVEKIRVDDLKARFKALPNYRACMYEAGFNVLLDKKWRKSKHFKNKCISENDLSYIEALEAVAPIVQAQYDEEKNERKFIKEMGSAEDQLEMLEKDGYDKWKARRIKIRKKYKE